MKLKGNPSAATVRWPHVGLPIVRCWGWRAVFLTVFVGCCLTAGATGSFQILVFSKTAAFRHASIEDGIAAITDLAALNNFGVVTTEDSAVFTDQNLASFKAIVFLSTTGDILDGNQQAAFERYIQKGGGFVGVHSASDTEYTWPWYGGLVGAYFANHPAIQNANVIVEDTNHVSAAHLPVTWVRNDEWYNFQTNPRSTVHVLCRLDETTYSGGSMGDHPIAWYHDYDGGRAWYTAGGHTSASYYDPLFRVHLLGGIRYAAGASIVPPPGASVLFDGTNTSAWASTSGGPITWTVTDGALQVRPGAGDIHTLSNYGDFQLHVEFRIPRSPPNTSEQNLGNSGIYVQGRYEIQILDSYGRALSGANDGGAIYGQKDADVNAALPLEKWETYDIFFRAARWLGAAKAQNASVTVYWNNIRVQDNVEILASTQSGSSETPARGPIRLQDLNTLVRFRNIWIVPLDGPPASPVTMIPPGAVWKYLDNGLSPAINWNQLAFNDSLWASGPAMLGYGDANGVLPRTTNSFGPNPNNKYITTYYRRQFVISNTWGLINLTARLQRDDGAVGYLNGAEVFRSNMPIGPVSNTTLASTAVGNADETRFYLLTVDPSLLRNGTNLLAVEIHQSATNSSDIVFDLALQAERLQPPRLNITRASEGVQLSWPSYAEGLDLYSATSLAPPNSWTRIAAPVNLSNNLRTIALPVAPNENRFYRLQSP
ncbi:MAG TPA: ThuA domain-containing protein [Verrucomicrobiae bacterium]|nr:ThuA domain-containing protein [Verrucomicrobiae bacterium]